MLSLSSSVSRIWGQQKGVPAVLIPVPTFLLSVPISSFTNVRKNVAWYYIDIPTAYKAINFNTEGSLAGTDTEIGLYDSNGNLIGDDDESGTDYLSSLTLTLSAGTYYIAVGLWDILWGATNFNAVGSTPMIDDTTVKLNVNGGNTVGWLKTIETETSGNYFIPNGVVNNNLGETIVSSWVIENSQDNLSFVKINSNGNTVWQKTILNLRRYDGVSMQVDTSNNIYVLTAPDGDSASKSVLLKMDNNGVLLAQKDIIVSAVNPNTNGLILDNVNSILYAGGYGTENFVNPTSGYLYAFNLSLTLIRQTKIQITSETITQKGLVVDSTGNVYVSLLITNTSGFTRAAIVKIDSSGNHVWSSRYELSNNGGQPDLREYTGVAIDEEDNLYFAVCYDTGVVTQNLFVIKFIKINNAGTILWQKTISYDDDIGFFRLINISCDNNNNVYLFINRDENLQILKFSSSGTLLFKRFVRSTTFFRDDGWGNESTQDSNCGYSRIVSTDQTFFNIYSTTSSKGLVGKLLLDGSETGERPGYFKYCENMSTQDYNPTYYPISPLQFTINDSSYIFSKVTITSTLSTATSTIDNSSYTLTTANNIVNEMSVIPGTCS